jgi:hypothetical protein
VRDVVHHAADGALVAGNRRAPREDDGVVLGQLDVPVIVDGDARQRRHRLALRAVVRQTTSAGGWFRTSLSRICTPVGTFR